ncbi:isochorismate synthase 2, chloroplastic-like [Pyrus x bretschneideri]|uniref:isochorismate synthase 2, chloroplastic-like n=1 Tax=Pyrus x bretschneideri TaxID=225117 RepID=UPI002030C012|nr:isochorismate synthase 2, chloroplastic-like [Pyrus x bretschneideri]
MATAAAAAAARPCLMDPEAAAKCSITVPSRQTIHFSHHRSQLCSLSMNGCQGVSHLPLGTVETRSFPAVPTPSLALDRLSSAILNSNPPPSSSGIIRLQNQWE